MNKQELELEEDLKELDEWNMKQSHFHVRIDDNGLPFIYLDGPDETEEAIFLEDAISAAAAILDRKIQ